MLRGSSLEPGPGRWVGSRERGDARRHHHGRPPGRRDRASRLRRGHPLADPAGGPGGPTEVVIPSTSTEFARSSVRLRLLSGRFLTSCSPWTQSASPSCANRRCLLGSRGGAAGVHRSTSSWIKSERPFSDHDKASPRRQIPPAEMIRTGARSVAVGRGRLAAGVRSSTTAPATARIHRRNPIPKLLGAPACSGVIVLRMPLA